MAFCESCGKPLAEGVRFCAGCGKAVTASTESSSSAPEASLLAPATRRITPDSSAIGRRRVSRRTLAIVVAALILASGCIAAAVVALRASEANDATTTAEEKASIPSLEFIDPSSLPQGANVAAGTTLAPGSYTVFMTGERIRTVQWVQNTNRSDEIDLQLTFDAKGTRQFAQLTSQNLNKPVPMVIGGKIIVAPVVQAPILDGRLVISGPTTDLQTILGSRIVPAP